MDGESGGRRAGPVMRSWNFKLKTEKQWKLSKWRE